MTTLNLRSALLALSLASVSLMGCPGEDIDPTPDASTDSGTDAGTDAGDDAGTDAGDDAGEDPDPVVTGGAASSAQIQAVRDVADGALATALAVDTVAVTYLRPQIGSDSVGFFVQAEKTGPALFVAIDPATLEPAPVVGDIVSFKVSEVGTAGGLKQVKAITDYAKSDEGFEVETLVQDVSTVDLPATLPDYVSELITVNAGIVGDFYACSPPNLCAEITTTGVPAAVSALRFRTTQDVVDANSLRTGCAIEIGPTPLWMFANAGGSTAQPSAWAAADVSASGCPAVEVVSAAAASFSEVQVKFDTSLKADSVTAAAFTVSSAAGPLAVTAAVLSAPNTVTITTANQTAGDEYTVTVAPSVTDMNAVAASTTANTAVFSGFVTPATVVINEVDANIGSGCDLVELRVTAGGSMGGFKFVERATAHFTFPANFSVPTNALIVLHFDKNDTTNCTGGVPAPADETVSPSEVPNSATAPRNLDTAYDFWVTKDGLTNTNNAYSLVAPAGEIVDFLLTYVSGTAAGATATAATAAAAAGEWTVATEGDYTAALVPNYAVIHTGVVADGSVQRSNDTDTNNPTGWGQAVPTFGALNVGQVAIP